MADPTEPIPDSPPLEPIDVKVNPDAAPSEPFDVPIYPDGPPGQPFDVTVTPDRGPVGTFDVPTTPDRGPLAPFDVPVNPDGPPAVPFAVTTTPDAAPRAPFDVTVSPDAPPRAAFDVPVAPDAPPATPFQVSVSADAPPGAPVQVAITPDAPPSQPFDVATTPSRPPAPTFNVPTFPDLPAIQIMGQPGDTPTMDQIVQAVVGFNSTLGTFLASLIEIDPIQVNVAGGGALDPTILAKWFRDYTQAVGPTGVARFIAEQSALYAMNPTTARIFDPTYFLKMMIPGSMGHAVTTVDVEAGGTMETIAIIRDKLDTALVQSDPVRPGGRPDLYGPENWMFEGQAYSVDTLVDAAIDGTFGGATSPYTTVDSSGLTRFDASKFFEPRDSNGAMLVRASAKARAASGVENISKSKLAASAATDGVIRVGVPGEERDGSILSPTADPSEVVDDDDARVPLSFTDLRQVPGKRFRSVYFRPTDLQFSEAITPEFSDASSFGRVDPIVGYQKTTRTVNVSFAVHAFAPEDLERMYNKMVWLKSMCYPTFGADSLIQSGPVVRMRIGDAVSTDLGGVPGVIRSLNFDFADALWELKKGMKVPRMFKVTLDFLVLHDGPVGILNGSFGVFQLPVGGAAPDKDTNFGTKNDSRTETPDGPTQLPGRFSKFGEPRS